MPTKVFFLTLLLLSQAGWALDVVKVAAANQNKNDARKTLNNTHAQDDRVIYRVGLLTRILEKTKAEFGPYQIEYFTLAMNRFRALEELQSGVNVNVYLGSESALGNSTAIVVPHPASRGVLNYRLLVVHKDSLAQFSAVKGFDDLKTFTTGVRPDWTSSKILERHGVAAKYAQGYDALFNLLKHKRIDYILRSPTEALPELERRQDFADFRVVPDIALVMPLLTLLHVSPSEPRLAQRLEAGLRQMHADGELKEVFDLYYREYFRQANICQRRLIYLDPADQDKLDQLGDTVYRPCEERDVPSQ